MLAGLDIDRLIFSKHGLACAHDRGGVLGSAAPAPAVKTWRAGLHRPVRRCTVLRPLIVMQLGTGFFVPSPPAVVLAAIAMTFKGSYTVTKEQAEYQGVVILCAGPDKATATEAIVRLRRRMSSSRPPRRKCAARVDASAQTPA